MDEEAMNLGSRFEVGVPGLLELFIDQVCKCFRVWGWIMGLGSWMLDLA